MLSLQSSVSELPKFWAATFCPNPDFLSYERGNCHNSLLWVAFKSENLRQFFGIPKNIPKSCFKFVHPVHDIDKTLILNFFDFTSLTYLLVAQKFLQDHYQKYYIVKAFYTYTNMQQ